MKNDQKIEEVLNETLNLKEKGASISEILELYPEYENEIKETYKIIEIISMAKSEIEAPKEILAKIINQINSPYAVTKEKKTRYYSRYYYKDILRYAKFLLPIGITAAVMMLMINRLGNEEKNQTAQDLLNDNVIQSELKKLNNLEIELNDFFAEEKNLQEINEVLTEL